MTDEALARQLQTQGAIHDAIFAKSEEHRQLPVDSTDWEHCPTCKSGQIEGGNIQIDGKEAWQPVSCLNCGSSWTEVYEANIRINIERGTT